MKTIYILVALLMAVTVAYGQTNILSATDVKTLDGTTVSSDNIIKPGTLTMLVFWKSTSNECYQNLESLQDIWLDSHKENGVNLVSVCVDAVGSYCHIKPYVNGNGWEFDTYIDVNNDLKRSMGVTEFPCTILLDKDHNQIFRYEGFYAGSEDLFSQKALDQPLASVK